MSPRVYAGAVSALGRRDQNEDAVLADGEHGFFVVADGTGGRAGGKTAANLALDTVAGELRRGLAKADDVSALVDRALISAHQHIREAQKKAAAEHHMSTTAVVLVVRDETLYVAHVGDSRAYLWRRGQIQQLTRDHSYANYLADHPEVRPKGDRPGTMLMRALGAGAEVPRADHRVEPLQAGDVVLACSDGASTPLSDWVLAGLLSGAGEQSEDACAAALVKAALAHGSQDNISAVVLRFAETERRAPALGWLAFVEGEERGRVVPLGSLTTLGASPECEVVLSGAFVSGKHSQIRATSEGFVLKDLASTNGTFINEQKVREELLADSDVLRLGSVSLIFKCMQAED